MKITHVGYITLHTKRKIDLHTSLAKRGMCEMPYYNHENGKIYCNGNDDWGINSFTVDVWVKEPLTGSKLYPYRVVAIDGRLFFGE
jgi:hypothetical protein